MIPYIPTIVAETIKIMNAFLFVLSSIFREAINGKIIKYQSLLKAALIDIDTSALRLDDNKIDKIYIAGKI